MMDGSSAPGSDKFNAAFVYANIYLTVLYGRRYAE